MKELSFLCFIFLWMFCKDLSAQNELVNLHLKNVPIEDFFLNIQEQTGLNFIYRISGDFFKERISVDVKDEQVVDVLKNTLNKLGYTFSINGGLIVIYPNKEDNIQGHLLVGKVKDEKGNPLTGVTVQIEGLNYGVATDKNGLYRLILPKLENVTLIYSFVGLKSVTLKYKGEKIINVTLKEDNKKMSEVVITGYQTLKKQSVAGSVSGVKSRDLLLNGNQTLESALQGKIPGMMVMNKGGLTGMRQRVRVRGTSTLLGNAEPVWVVDGIVQEDPIPFQSNELNNLNINNVDMIRNFVGGAISWLNPNDIDQVTVLKDASATAIYGVKAANGVIVITTKKGQVGRMSVSYSGNFSLTPRLTYKKMEVMNSKERVDVSREAFRRNLVLDGQQNIGYTALAMQYRRREISLEEFTQETKKLETHNTDWFDILFRNAFSHNHNLGISGGVGETTYHASLGYSKQENSAKGNNQTQYTGNLNLSTKFFDCLHVNTSFAGSVSKTSAFAGLDPYAYASKTNRAIAARKENGELFYYKYDNGYLFNVINELEQSGNKNTLSSLNASFSFRLDLLDGFILSSMFSYAHSNIDGQTWYTESSNHIAMLREYNFEEYLEGSQPYLNSHLPYGGELTQILNTNENWNWRNQLDYVKLFKEVHSLSFVFGQEMRSSINGGYSKKQYGYLYDKGKIFIQLPQTVGENALSNKYLKELPSLIDTKANYLSLYFSGIYVYDNRYVVNFSIRSDASNRFGQNKKNRFLPVWALGTRWNVGNESWLNHSSLISDLNMQVSYGFQGNVAENVSPSLIANIFAWDSGDYVLTVDKLPAPNLKWEKVQSVNLGIDASFFNKKIHGSFEWYMKRTKDMIINYKVPYANGIRMIPINGGNMTNNGWDANINFVPVRMKDFIVSLGFNFGKNKNQVKSTLAPKGTWREAVAGNLNKKGYAVSSFWAFRYKGLNREHGGPEFDLSGMDKDGADKDATLYMDYVGKLEPDFNMGMSLTIRYNMFTLSSNLYLSLGNQKFRAPISDHYTSIPSEYENMSKEWLARWRKPGDERNTTIPSLPDKRSNARSLNVDKNLTYMGYMNPYELYANSDIRVVDAWYLRCNNIALSYTFSEKTLPKFVQNINLNCSISNPFQIVSKGFLGKDPEVLMGNQPLNKILSLGFSASF